MPRPEVRLLRLVEIPRGRLIGAILLAAGASGASVALLGVSAWLIMRASFHPPVLWLMVAVVGVRFFGISRGVLRYAERILGHDVAFDALRSLRLKVYAKLERLAPVGALWRKGDLLDRLIADVDALADLVTRVILPLASSGLVFCGAILAASMILPSAGAVLAVMVLIAVVLGPFLVLRGDERDETTLRAVRARRTALVAESVLAASDPGLRAAQSNWIREADALDEQEGALATRAARRAGLAAGVSMLALAGGVVAILALAAQAAASGQIAAENAAVIVMLPLGLLELAAGIEPALAALLGVRASATRLVEVLDQPERPDTAGSEGVPPDAWPITLDDASIAWPGRRPVVTGMNLVLRPGCSVALIGPSGVGKSTVIAGLMGYASIVDGRYEVGDTSASRLSGDALRSLYAWCDQDAHLFDTTVAENLRLAKPDATDAQLHDALARAQLTEWVAGLPKGIDTRVGQYGVLVSGGQRQRIGLARALLADRPVLLVDEPTAGLDQQTANALLDDIVASSAGKALLVVTHDRSGLFRFDETIDMSRYSAALSGGASR